MDASDISEGDLVEQQMEMEGDPHAGDEPGHDEEEKYDDESDHGEEEEAAVEPKLRLSLTGLDKEKTTKESLQEYFGQFGEVSECILSMGGDAVIKMGTEEAVNAVLAANNKEGSQIVDGASVEVKADNNDDGKETKLERSPRLFIGGLHYTTKDEDLRDHFEKYGQLKECFVARKKQKRGSLTKGKAKGFGYVTMSTMEEMEALLKETHVINDKTLSVMVSKPRDTSERRLVLGLFHLDKEKTTKGSLMAHFSQYGNVKHCTVSMEQLDGKTVSQGTGFVTMATEEELKAVLNGNVDGYQTIDEKSVLVKRGVTDKKNHDLLRRLWFGGLDREKTTEADVLEYFCSFGTVEKCVIARDPPIMEGGECRSKGFGFIIMETIRDTIAILKHPEEHRIHDKVLAFNRTLKKPSKPDGESVEMEKSMKKTNTARAAVRTSPGRGKGSMRGRPNTSHNSNRKKASASRDDVLYGSDVGNYNRPRQGGSFQYEDDYYGEDSSSYGPMRAPVRRGPPGGGWVFVDDIYGQPDDSFHSTQAPGFRGNWQQNSHADSGGYGGGHNSNWGKGNNTNRNKRRGRGRPY